MRVNLRGVPVLVCGLLNRYIVIMYVCVWGGGQTIAIHIIKRHFSAPFLFQAKT